MERTERLAALGHLARVGVTLCVLGVVDRSEAVGAANGVAEQSLQTGRENNCMVGR